ncbi:MAG: beta-carotene hydroxylase [Acidimicrobiales bacterium]
MTNTMKAALVVGVTAFVMEPVASVVHRFFGHGPGWGLHEEHHQPTRALERNDLIPLAGAAVAMAAFAVGTASPRHRWLVPVASGVTVYGFLYGLVHDVYIHRRLPILPRRVRVLEPWRRAHLEHHRTEAAPFGVLLPLRPGWGLAERQVVGSPLEWL